MSTINKNNYEAFLLDYVEQNLSPDLVAELMLFLEQNPDLKAELEAFENVTFTTNPSTTFNEKQHLKQVAIENLMITEIEKLNTPQQSKELFEEIAQNANYKKLFSTYQKTILTPTPIVFADKKSLKQKETKVVSLYWWISSAAAILVMFLLLKNFNSDKVEQVAVKSSNPVTDSSPSTIGTQQLANNKSQNSNNKTQITKLKIQNTYKEQGTNNLEKSGQIQQLETRNSKLETQKEMIEIEPYKEKEYITIEAFAENTEQPTTTKNDEYLTVSELLKQEAQKRLMENEVKTSSKELIAANMVAKVLGKNAEVETVENIQGETEEYALNIGEFSFSRKIRK